MRNVLAGGASHGKVGHGECARVTGGSARLVFDQTRLIERTVSEGGRCRGRRRARAGTARSAERSTTMGIACWATELGECAMGPAVQADPVMRQWAVHMPRHVDGRSDVPWNEAEAESSSESSVLGAEGSEDAASMAWECGEASDSTAISACIATRPKTTAARERSARSARRSRAAVNARTLAGAPTTLSPFFPSHACRRGSDVAILTL